MIKMEYLTTEETAPDGKSIVQCEVCKRKFALPAGAELLIKEKICEECAAEKAKADAVTELKENSPEELKKALGE